MIDEMRNFFQKIRIALFLPPRKSEQPGGEVGAPCAQARPRPIDASLKWLFVAGALALAAFFYLGEQASPERIKALHGDLAAWSARNAIAAPLLYMLVHVLATAFSVPVATALTLLCGSLFGFAPGVCMTAFAGACGATTAFLLARRLFREAIRKKYAGRLQKFNSEFAENGAFYLFALRLTPLAPFFLVNIFMGLTPVRTAVFFLVSLAGMLPLTAVYVYAGVELAALQTPADIISPRALAIMAVIGAAPLVGRKLGARASKRQSVAGQKT